MPSTYTPNLGLEKIATGEQAGVWGVTADNSYDFLDTAIDGGIAVTVSASAYTLITNQGVPSEGRNKVITFSGSVVQDVTVTIAPNTASKVYFVTNSTTGGFSLIFTQGTGPTFTLRNGRSAIVYANGRGGVSGVVGAIDNLQVNSLQIIGALTIGGAVNFGSPITFGQTTTFNAAAAFNAGVTANAITVSSLTVNVGGDQVWDLYYRSSGGNLTRLGIGANGQFLGVAGGALAYIPVNTSIGIGTPIVGGAGQCVLFVDGAGRMAQDGALTWTPGGSGLAITSGAGLSVSGRATVGNGLTVSGGGLSVTGNCNITGQYQVNGVPLAQNWTDARQISADLTLNPAFQSVPGTRMTLPSAGRYLVIGVFWANGGQIAGSQMQGAFAGGPAGALVRQGLIAILQGQFNGTVCQQWIFVAAGANYEVELQAASTVAGMTLLSPETTITATWISP
jgi:hypothetical protein